MKISNPKPFLSFILIFLFAGFISVANATYINLHEFAGGASDGGSPYNSSLLLYNDAFYGMTFAGGGSDGGTVFKIDIDGSNCTILHEFTGGAGDGCNPMSSLTLSGSTLYGTTSTGGGSNEGTVFKIDVDGSNYTNLHEFTGGAGDGANPYSSVTISGSTLYGTTTTGGGSNQGTVFKIDIDGSNYTILHEFTGLESDGANPYSSVTISGSTLYGMTLGDGSGSSSGTVFKIDVDGSNYTNLHKFAGGTGDGNGPCGSLLLSGSTLYGMTTQGGTAFKIDTDGNNYNIIHIFTSGDGQMPYSTLIVSGGALVGTTMQGGAGGMGVIFKMGFNGGDYTLIHEFAGGAGDGAMPGLGSLLEYNNSLYGMALMGGVSNAGVIFEQTIPEPGVIGIILMISGILLKLRKNYNIINF